VKTIVTFELPESAAAPGRYWVTDLLRPQASDANDGALLDMRLAGCAEIRSTVNGHQAVLVFTWRRSPVPVALGSTEYVKRWTTFVGWPCRVEETPAPKQLDAVYADSSSVVYLPDVNGRPCTPPGRQGHL
jgi:hypothetical protein